VEAVSALRDPQLRILLAAAFVLRMALLPLNSAEYTDGILQLIQFEQPSGIWPPLYTALCWPLGKAVGPLWAGRLVSAIASTLAIVPICRIAQRLYGDRAALHAGIICMLAPAALRWAPRVMTEATFSLLFWWACERIVAALQEPERAVRCLVGACVAGALASLTRYQGLLAAPLVAGAALCVARRGGSPWKAMPALALFAAPLLWSQLAGNIHGEQFAERSAMAPFLVLLANAEPFVLLTPYFLTYPVAACAVLGALKAEGRDRLPFAVLVLAVGGALIVVQSLFSSFQERYLLPWYGLLFVYAGAGLAHVMESLRRRGLGRLAPYAALATHGFAAMVAALVLYGSRDVFGDLRRAAEAAAATGAPRIFTNETYRVRGDQVIAGDKVRFFAPGREVLLLAEMRGGRTILKPGDVIVLSGAYGAEQVLMQLQGRANLEFLAEEKAVVLPVFPDIMARPGTAQNPSAFVFRYEPQPFSSTVWRVVSAR
jgi:4-amino-4-deoxy-L-arabinose transferase-like glycosyltransferase